jgi:hypothetical protein
MEEFVGKATPEQIAAWKAANPNGIYLIEVGGHVGYFKNPGRDEVNSALSQADKEMPLDMFAELANSTFLGGSDLILKDEPMFIGLANAIKVKLDGKKAVLVNL